MPSIGHMGNLLQDVRYAMRMLRQAPVFTAVAIGSLALGIGANTAIFTLMDAIMLRWLPVQNPQQLVVLGRNPARFSASFNYPDYRYVRDNSRSYAGVIASSIGARRIGFSVPGRTDVPQLVSMHMVSGNYFNVLGVQSAVGRLFNDADNQQEGAHPHAVLSHAFWKRAFGEDTGVVGRDVLLNGSRFQVIGVAREGFTGTTTGVSPDLFTPIIMYRTFNPASGSWNTRTTWWLTVLGRLKPGVTQSQAESELNIVWQQILQNDPNRKPAPAFRSTRPDLVPALKADAATAGSGRSAVWDLRRSLVAARVALSLLLLAGAGLFVRTLTNLKNLDPGMNRENLLFLDTNIGQLGYQPQRERMFSDRLRQEVQRMPGVRAAATASITPQSGSRWNNWVQIEGYKWKPDEPPHVDMNAVTPRFFEAAGIPIVLGRDFRDSDALAVLPDRPAQPPPPGTEVPGVPGPPRVAIVNEAFVRKFLAARQSPIGIRLSMGDKWRDDRTHQIVGVVRDARYFDLRKAVEPMIYQPAYRETGANASVLTVRTTDDPNRLIDAIRRRTREIEGAVSVTDTRTMEDNMNRTLMQERFVATLGGFFGVVALILAAIGLYGVMSQSVTRRTREIGIRMALGAEARKVLWLILRDAMIMVTIGTVIGVIAAIALTRYTESMLYGVKAHDPWTLAAAGAVLIAVTAMAGFLPARRATRVAPMRALREE